jgi:hypothetical protein
MRYKVLCILNYFALFIIISALLVCSLLWACTKDVGTLPIIVFDDAALVALVKNDSGKVTWKNAANDSLFTSGAEHGSKQYKLRMNAIASAACTDAGKLPTGGVFPDASLLVKQLYAAPGGAVEKYAVLYKKNGAWLWAEYGVGGNVVHGFNESSATCTGCHTSNRDKTWTFDSH